MRVVTVMAVLLLGGAATLEAQHRFQFEIGGFASFTRFDRALLLDNQIGGGGRIGFWITDWLGIEGDGLVQRPHPKGGGAGTDFPVWFASGSIVLNFGSEKSRSEEHTSELQSQFHLVCRLLLEKKNRAVQG